MQKYPLVKYAKSFFRAVLLFLVDFVAIYVANYVAIVLRLYLVNTGTFVVPDNLPPIQGPFYPGWIWVVFLSISLFYRLYSNNYSFWDEFKKIIIVSFLSFIISMSLSYLGTWSDLDHRFLVVVTTAIYIPTALVLKVVTKIILYRTNLCLECVVIFNTEEQKDLLSQTLRNNKYMLIKPKKFVRVKNFTDKTFENLLKQVQESAYDVSVISLDNAPEIFVSKLISSLHTITRKIYLVPDIGNLPLLNSEMFMLISNNVPVISIRNNLMNPVNRFIKRCFDIVFSIFVIILFLPVMLFFAIVIVIESPGWPIYKSRRVGIGGKEFYCYKLRSMYTNADEVLAKILKENEELKKEWETYRKLKNDPRVTKVGKFIRKFSIDELPQFFNVLKGEMSIVGPRAVTKEEIEKYYREEGKFYYFLVRPGITGIWQVSGRNEKDYNFRVRADIWYVENWSFWLDIVTILKTIPAVFKTRGAY